MHICTHQVTRETTLGIQIEEPELWLTAASNVCLATETVRVRGALALLTISERDRESAVADGGTVLIDQPKHELTDG